LRKTIREMFRIHPTAFGRQRLRPEHVTQIGEINYQIIRHALERDLRSRSLLKQISTV
jgi:hypothetical protein